MDDPDNHIGATSIFGKIKRIFGLEKPISIKIIADTVKDILAEKSQSEKENFEIIEHKTQFQFDVHSCGVFVEKHFLERIQGLTSSEVPEKFLDIQNSIEAIREDAAKFMEASNLDWG